MLEGNASASYLRPAVESNDRYAPFARRVWGYNNGDDVRGLVTAYSLKVGTPSISLPIALMTEAIDGDALASHESTVFLSLLLLLSQPSKTLVPVVADARFPRRKKP